MTCSFNTAEIKMTQGVNTTQKDFNKIINFRQQHPSEEGDECYSIVLKMGLNLAAKKNEKASTKKENILKFTNKEIDAMSEPVKILLIYSGYEIRYRTIKNTYQVRFRRDGYNIELCAKDLNTLRTRFLIAVEKAIPHKKSVTPLLIDYINNGLP